MTASFAFPFAAHSLSFNPTFFSPPTILPFFLIWDLYPFPLSLFFVLALCSGFLPLFTILSPLRPPFPIISPLRPLPPTFPLPFIGHPLPPRVLPHRPHRLPALPAAPISFYGLHGSKQEQFEGDCFPGAVGRAGRDSLAFFLFFL